MKEHSVLNKPVGIWIRVSTEDQAQGDSPEHHEERARSYAKSRGWQVKELYDLAGQSGKAVMQHPEARRMMKDIERGHISGLVFSKLARLSRNRRELEDFSDFFNQHEATSFLSPKRLTRAPPEDGCFSICLECSPNGSGRRFLNAPAPQY